MLDLSRAVNQTTNDDAHVALVLNSSTVVVYSLRTCEKLYTITTHTNIQVVSYSKDGAVLSKGGGEH